MSPTPDDPWGPIGAAVLRCLANATAPIPGAAVPAKTAVLIALGALAVALGLAVYTRQRASRRGDGT